jgi:GT2 family glycosyltransferase
MASDTTVYCVIPVHNRLEVTRRCLSYLEAQDYCNLQIIIIDDGSTDGTGEYLERCKWPNLTVIAGDGSLWWGGAMHIGIGHVIESAQETDYLLMLNDDVRVETNYVSTLVRESVANHGAVMGSYQREERSGAALGSGYVIDYWGMRISPVKTLSKGESVNALPARGALYPMRAVFRAGNINIKAFRHYLGDLEYSARIRELGWKLLISMEAAVVTSSDSSDKNLRGEGVLNEYFACRSRNNLMQRLVFFRIRGPRWLRIWAWPRYVVVRGWRLLSKVI